MGIHGRGFPQGTQYLTAPYRTQGATSFSGSGTMTLTASGNFLQVTTVVAASTTAQHRFHYNVEPPPTDLQGVQRHLQRMSDEIARAVNPVRSISDGGTGLKSVTAGAVMIGKTPNTMETLPIGGAGQVLTVVSGKPAWAASGGVGAGEANTASNVGIGGIGVVDGKVGVDLQFRSVKAASAKVTVALDAANKAVTVDVAVGTTVNTVCVGNDSRLSDSRTPLAHKTSHQSGGTDEISVAGLLGVLTNPQPPIIGPGAAQAVAGNDSRLTDARTPTGAAGGVLSGTYPSPGFLVDMATQAELDAAVAALVAADAAHVAAADPHPQYALDTDLAGYQRLADTRWDPVTDDRAGTREFQDDRMGVLATLADTRAGTH